MTDQHIATHLGIPDKGRFIQYDRTSGVYDYYYDSIYLGHAPSYIEADQQITEWLLAVQPIKEER